MSSNQPSPQCSEASIEELNNSAIAAKFQSGEYKISEKRGRSKVWEVFGRILNGNAIEIDSFVACRICKKVLKYNNKSTSNLVKHKCYILMRVNVQEGPKVDVDGNTKKQVTKVITSWVISNCRPYNIVKDEGLLEVLQKFLEIGAKLGQNIDLEKLVPHPTTIARNVEKLYNQNFLKVKDEICAIKHNGFGLTSDIWTDDFMKKSYIALTMHYVKDGSLKTRLLGMKSMEGERCTSENVYKKVCGLLSTFECTLSGKSIIVTDRGSNMKCAFKSSQHLYCINHLINNALEKAMHQVEEVSQLNHWSIKLVKYFKKSGLNAGLPSSLKSFCATRWNTIYYLLQSVESNWGEIINILNNKNELNRTKYINIESLRDILKILEPFEEASKNLEGEDYATMHLVIIYIHRLKKACLCDTVDSNVARGLKQKLLYHIENVVIPNITLWHKIAVFLFPPTNKLLQFSEIEKVDIEKECERIMISFQNELPNIQNEPAPLSTSALSKRNQLFTDFIALETLSDPTENITQEIQLYKSTKVAITENFDVLKWWESQKNNFPLLYKLSCFILQTPSSSASSERVFSIARNMLSEKRSALGLNEVAINQAMFIHFNVEKEELASSL